MPARCDVCGVETTLDSAFHQNRLYRLTRRKGRVLCPSCLRKRHALNSRNTLIFCGLVGVIGVLLIWIAPRRLWGWHLVSFFLLMLFQMLCILPHEFGHAIAAWLVGFRVFAISIGSFGRVLFTLRFRRIDLIFRSIPLGGSTLS